MFIVLKHLFPNYLLLRLEICMSFEMADSEAFSPSARLVNSLGEEKEIIFSAQKILWISLEYRCKCNQLINAKIRENNNDGIVFRMYSSNTLSWKYCYELRVFRKIFRNSRVQSIFTFVFGWQLFFRDRPFKMIRLKRCDHVIQRKFNQTCFLHIIL